MSVSEILLKNICRTYAYVSAMLGNKALHLECQQEENWRTSASFIGITGNEPLHLEYQQEDNRRASARHMPCHWHAR